MPVRYNAAVFPRFFSANSSINLPYLAKEQMIAPLGETRDFAPAGSICFTTNITQAECIPLARRTYGWYDPSVQYPAKFPSNLYAYGLANLSMEVIWLNGTFIQPRTNESEKHYPTQPRYAPFCKGDYEGAPWPWTACQSHITTWVDAQKYFSLSPHMSREDTWKTVGESSIAQDIRLNPFHIWLLCGTNGSCTDLAPLTFLQGGNRSLGNVSIETKVEATSVQNGSCAATQYCTKYNSTSMTQLYTRFSCGMGNCRLYQILNNTDSRVVPPTPVCLFPPFLFILSNSSFASCTNDTCVMSQCWDAKNFSNALVARVPRWIPVPVDSPNPMTLFRERRDFGATAAIVALISLSAAAATAAAVALSTASKTAAELNELAVSVATAIDHQASLDGALKGGIMILNQRVDLVEEQMEALWQLAQLGCEQKYRALCITSVQYENFTRAANLSRSLSNYLAGNWSQDFDGVLDELRREIVHINATRVDISIAEGLSSWFHQALSHVKEWAGIGGMGVLMLGGLGLLLWLLCRLRAQHRRDKVVLAQALMAVEIGASPQVWLNMLRKETQY